MKSFPIQNVETLLSNPFHSYIFLSIPIYWNTAAAVAVVSYAVVLYARNPMKQQQPDKDNISTAMEEGENLLKEEAEEATKGECCEKC